MARLRLACVLTAAVALAAPLLAHHSFAEYYLEGETLEVDGEIVEFQFKNPHSWVFVQGREGLGAMRTYAAEWAGTSRLKDQDITTTTLRPGDRVRIWASPNRNPSDSRVRLKRIERMSDGWSWGNLRRRDER